MLYVRGKVNVHKVAFLYESLAGSICFMGRQIGSHFSSKKVFKKFLKDFSLKCIIWPLSHSRLPMTNHFDLTKRHIGSSNVNEGNETMEKETNTLF